MHPTFLQSPGYQRAVRRRLNVDPREQAIPNLDDIVTDFSKEQADREEYGAGRATELGLQKRGFGLKKERFGLSKKRFEAGKELSIKRLAAQKEATDRDFALTREMMSAQKEQNKWATGLGVVNIGIEGMGALANIRTAEKEAEQMQLMTDGFLGLLKKYEDIELQKKKIY